MIYQWKMRMPYMTMRGNVAGSVFFHHYFLANLLFSSGNRKYSKYPVNSRMSFCFIFLLEIYLNGLFNWL